MRLFVVLVLGFVLLFVINKIYKSIWHKGLSVKIDFDEYVIREGDMNVINEIIENDKSIPICVLQVKFAITRSFLFYEQTNGNVTDQYYRNEYFSCGRNQKITRKYEFKASRRGVFRITSMEIISRDMLAENRMYADIPNRLSVTVLPARIKPEDIPEDFRLLIGDVVSRIKLYEDPFDFVSIREYRPFDPINHINWKATASNDTPEVNVFNNTSLKKVTVLMNVDTHIMTGREEMQEETIKIAACVATLLIENKIPVSFVSNVTNSETGEAIEIGVGCDSGHLRKIETALAFADIDAKHAPFEEVLNKYLCKENKEDEFIVISNYRKQSVTDVVTAMSRSGYDINWIVPEHSYISVDRIGIDREVKWVVDSERK